MDVNHVSVGYRSPGLWHRPGVQRDRGYRTVRSDPNRPAEQPGVRRTSRAGSHQPGLVPGFPNAVYQPHSLLLNATGPVDRIRTDNRDLHWTA